MEEPTVLRETKIGQKGFVKEDVMTFLDELNSKIVSLEDELKQAQDAAPADPNELAKYRSQAETLQSKLNESNNALREKAKELEATKKELEESKKIIAQLKAGGAAQGGGNVQNAQAAAALEAAKKEIDNLRNQLKAAEAKVAAAEKNAAAKAPAGNAPAADPKAAEAANAELTKAKQDLTKLSADLAAKTKELEAKVRESAEKDSKIAAITKDKDTAVAAKDDEIKKLNTEIEELKAKADQGGMIPPSFDMGALFTEAQKTASKITVEAQRAADNVTNEANAKADQILREANTDAEKTIANANLTAETCIKEANDQAKNTVNEANSHAAKVNEMAETVRKMLRNEIDNVNARFNDISQSIARLTGQASDRMDEAKTLIGEARNSIPDGEPIKMGNAPQAEFKPTKAPKAALSNEDGSKKPASQQAFANTASNYSNGNGGYNSGNMNRNQTQQAAPKPAAQNAPQSNQDRVSKSSANFNFDMAELLKAAEEEVSHSPEGENK